MILTSAAEHYHASSTVAQTGGLLHQLKIVQIGGCVHHFILDEKKMFFSNFQNIWNIL